MSKAPRISTAALRRLQGTRTTTRDKVTATKEKPATTPRVQRGGQSFDVWCAQLGLPEPTAEHRFDSVRRFRFDWAWIEQRIAVEQEGGIWTQGRHTRGSGYASDMTKYNLAAAHGWRVFRFTPAQIRNGVAARFLDAHWTQLTTEA
jgi:hypothetical protein